MQKEYLTTLMGDTLWFFARKKGMVVFLWSAGALLPVAVSACVMFSAR